MSRATTMPPKIGHRRVYQPGQKPLIYPGELAHVEALISPEEVELHHRTGFPIDVMGRARVTVDPMPGLGGALLRLRWRLFRGARPLQVLPLVLTALAILVMWVRADVAIALSSASLVFTVVNWIRYRRKRHARRPWEA